MSALDPLLEFLQRPLASFERAVDVDHLFHDALRELERHAREAAGRRDARAAEAQHRDELRALREEEAAALQARAAGAQAAGQPAEAARLGAAAERARADAGAHAAARDAARAEARSLEGAAEGLARAVEDGRARLEEVRRHLQQVKGASAPHRVDAGHAPRAGPGVHATQDERRQATESAFRRMEAEQRADEKLAELKRKMGRG